MNIEPNPTPKKIILEVSIISNGFVLKYFSKGIIIAEMSEKLADSRKITKLQMINALTCLLPYPI